MHFALRRSARIAAVLVGFAARDVSGQQLEAAGAGTQHTLQRHSSGREPLAGLPTTQSSNVRMVLDVSAAGTMPTKRRASWWAPAASLLVPGSGQLLLGQQRSVAYAVAEVFLIAQSMAAQRNVSNGIREYQRIAADVARKSGGTSLPTGSWTYYEALERYDASGAFDRAPGGVVDPETDVRTFNGEMWLLARTTYWNNPDVAPAIGSREYQRALAFYTNRAFRDEFAWSWRDATLQKGIYVQAVAATNRSNQRKTNLLTAVGANHVASLIDAYISVRIRRYGGAGLVGMKVDGMETRVSVIGDPANGFRAISTQLRIVPTRASGR